MAKKKKEGAKAPEEIINIVKGTFHAEIEGKYQDISYKATYNKGLQTFYDFGKTEEDARNRVLKRANS